MNIPTALLDAAVAAVLYDGSCAQQQARSLLDELAWDPEQPDPLPSLREVEEAIAVAVDEHNDAIAAHRALQFEFEASRGIRTGGW